MYVLVKRAPLPASRHGVAPLGLVRPDPARYPCIASPAAFLKVIKIYRPSYFSLPPSSLFHIAGCPLRFSCAGLRPLLLASAAYCRSVYPALVLRDFVLASCRDSVPTLLILVLSRPTYFSLRRKPAMRPCPLIRRLIPPCPRYSSAPTAMVRF